LTLNTIEHHFTLNTIVYCSTTLDIDVLIEAVYGKRGKGRPKTRYSDNIREFGGNRSFAYLYRLAQNKEEWRATAVQINELSVY